MSMRGISRALLFTLSIVSAASCTGAASAPINKLVEPVDVKTGWFDAGIEDGKNKLVPSVTLTLKNVSSEDVANVLPSGSRVIVYCNTGERSAAAAFVLKRLGYEVSALHGGLGAMLRLLAANTPA